MAKKREHQCLITENDQEYVTFVRFSSKRHTLGAHFDKKGHFIISVPYAFPLHLALKFARESLPKLLKACAKRNSLPVPILGDEVYLFGLLTHLDGFSLLPKNKQKDLLKNRFDDYLFSRVKELSKIMDVPLVYIVRSREMKNSYGINNFRKKYLSFSLELVHYNKHIIDSVIIHELAHHFEHNHSKNFYKIVLEYVPDYWESRKKLINHLYA